MQTLAFLIDFDLWRHHGPTIARGAWVTIQLTVAGMIMGLIIGLGAALMLLSRYRVLRFFARLYVEVIRGVPALVILFLFYFGLANLGLVLDPLLSAILTFGIIGGAFMAEIYRAGILAIDPGQTEAAKALGMKSHVMMRRIILPQAVRVVLPPMTNTSIAMLKDTSLVVTIGVADVTYRAYNAASITYQAMPIYVIAGLVYLGMTYPLSIGARRLEMRLNREHHVARAGGRFRDRALGRRIPGWPAAR